MYKVWITEECECYNCSILFYITSGYIPGIQNASDVSLLRLSYQNMTSLNMKFFVKYDYGQILLAGI